MYDSPLTKVDTISQYLEFLGSTKATIEILLYTSPRTDDYTENLLSYFSTIIAQQSRQHKHVPMILTLDSINCWKICMEMTLASYSNLYIDHWKVVATHSYLVSIHAKRIASAFYT